MRTKTKVLIAAALVAAAGTGAGVAIAGGDTDQPIPVSERDKAAQAALEHTGGGKVTETEVGDEESYYEVEVTKDDGSQVDVQLDENFNVVGSKVDDAGEDESGSD